MPLEHLRILSVLVVSSAFTALLSGDFETVLFVLLISSTVPLWFDIDLDRIRAHRFWRFYGLGTLALVGGLFMMQFPIKVSVFLLVLFCIIYELYGERRRYAPTRLLSLLSFLVVLYQARIESGLNLFFGILIYVYAIVWCLYAFHAAPVHGYRFQTLLRLGAWPALRITVVVLIIGIGFFWIMPRLPGQSLTAIPSLGGSRLSGFGERVTLNDIRTLKLSRKHVMDIKPLSGQLHHRYLKGKVLDKYDKGIWSSTVYAVFYPLPKEGNQYVLRSTTEQVYEYEVDLEALHGNTVFFFDNLLELKGLPQPLKHVGGTDHLSVMRSFPLALSYTFKASAEPPRKARNVASSIYLQVPKNLRRELAELGDELLPNNADIPTKVRILNDWFKSQFAYSLKINNRGKGEPLRHFLFERRAGHCELFASGMIMLLRAQGIHARLVTGFFVPDAHPSGDFHHITESDAHAWVEVLYNDHWMMVDPTPPAAPTEPGFAEAQIAYLKYFWRTKVMTWNYDRQKSAFGKGKEYLGRFKTTAWAYIVPLLLALVAAGVLYYLLRTRPTNKAEYLARLYRRLDKLLQRHYGSRDPAMGMYPFVTELPMPDQLRQEACTFLDGYYHYRFASGDTSDEIDTLVKQCRALILRLKHEIST